VRKISDKLASALNDDHTSRRRFFRHAFTGVAVVAPVGVLAACGDMADMDHSVSANTDQQKTSAETDFTKSKQIFHEIMKDENEHVKFLQDNLKSAARPKPTFQKLEQADIQSFVNLSHTLENVGVGAYLFAAPAVSQKTILAAAGSILTIEARHAGFLGGLLQKPLSVNGAFDKPLTQAEIVKAASPFIASLNGGPDPSAPLKSDVDILNFALLLEFLEAEFYNVNVPKLFK
jgi:hypothetical protein